MDDWDEVDGWPRLTLAEWCEALLLLGATVAIGLMVVFIIGVLLAV